MIAQRVPWPGAALDRSPREGPRAAPQARLGERAPRAVHARCRARQESQKFPQATWAFFLYLPPREEYRNRKSVSGNPKSVSGNRSAPAGTRNLCRETDEMCREIWRRRYGVQRICVGKRTNCVGNHFSYANRKNVSGKYRTVSGTKCPERFLSTFSEFHHLSGRFQPQGTRRNPNSVQG